MLTLSELVSASAVVTLREVFYIGTVAVVGIRGVGNGDAPGVWARKLHAGTLGAPCGSSGGAHGVGCVGCPERLMPDAGACVKTELVP